MKMGVLIRLAMAAALGLLAALLVSCGTSGKGLIPLASAGPLRTDFEAVASAAQAGNGQCTTTKQAIEKTESDFRSLPPSVDQRLHAHLSEGIEKLRSKALALCEQVLASTATNTTASTKSAPTTTTQSTPTTTVQSTPTTTTTTNTQATTPPTPGGGTQAPGEHEEEPTGGPGVGKGGEPPGHERNDGGTGGPGQGNENSLGTR